MPMEWTPEDWARLGKAIRASREFHGYSRKSLAELAAVSEKSIQLAEEGRVPRGRWPQSLNNIEKALGYMPGTMKEILDGNEPSPSPKRRSFLSPFPTVSPTPRTPGGDHAAEAQSAESEESTLGLTTRERQPDRPDFPDESDAVSAASQRAGLLSQRTLELTQSGQLAQDTFIRQAKRYRKLQSVTIEALAQRVADLGADIELKDLKSLENGTRLLRMSEADVIARALDTTVDWLLGSAFRSGMPEEMTAPPTDEELQAEAKAVEQRLGDMGTQVMVAHEHYQNARRREAEARQAAEMAMVVLHQTEAQQAELARQYQYLLGRIDSLRAAKGEELILQTHPVYDDREDLHREVSPRNRSVRIEARSRRRLAPDDS